MNVLRIPVVDPDGVVTVKTEALRMFAVQIVVRYPGMFDEEFIKSELDSQLRRELDRLGRRLHGDITYAQHEDHLRDSVLFRAEAMTRESDQGRWPEIWAAIHQDEEDRSEALRHPADYLDD